MQRPQADVSAFITMLSRVKFDFGMHGSIATATAGIGSSGVL
jgi:hypothetical protein